jgi:hypothetical protein
LTATFPTEIESFRGFETETAPHTNRTQNSAQEILAAILLDSLQPDHWPLHDAAGAISAQQAPT